MRLARAAMAALLSAATLAGCSVASYDERMTYLRKVAVRGVETHVLIASSEGSPDRKRCEAAFHALDFNDIPDDIGGGGVTEKWRDQIKMFFTDSCVSGKPKEVPAPGATAVPDATGGPSSSPSVAP